MNPWIVRFGRDPRPSVRLFCFPYAGGGARIFRPWADELPSSIDVWSLQAPGREERIHAAPLAAWPQLVAGAVDAIAPLLDRPFAFFGHSLGALVAYETARALAARHAPEPFGLYVSGHRAPHLPDRNEPIDHLPDADFVREIGKLNGTPPEVLACQDILDLLMPVLRADFMLASTYRQSTFGAAELTCDVAALGSYGDTHATADELSAWQSVTRGGFRLHMFPGDHFYVNEHRDLLLEYLTRQLVAGQTACDGGLPAGRT